MCITLDKHASKDRNSSILATPCFSGQRKFSLSQVDIFDSRNITFTMMSVKFAPALFLLSLAIGQQQFPHGNALAQDIEYLATPELVWETQTSIILDGNGVFTSPNDRLSVVTQANGNLAAFNTFTGESLWTFTPPSNNGLPTSCQGGATFSGDGYNDYLIYSVVDDPNGLVPFT